MTKASDNAFPSLLITEGTEPSAPAAGKQRVYIDSTTHKLKRTDSSGVDVTIEGGASLAAAVSVQTSGADYTTTSAVYADIDGTNLSLTLTTGAHRCKVTWTAGITHSDTTQASNIDVLVDGTGLGSNGVWQYRATQNGQYQAWSWAYVTAALTAASHTIKLQWKTSGATLTVNRSAFPNIFLVEELPI